MRSRETWGRLRQTRAARIVAVYSATAWGVFEILDKAARYFRSLWRDPRAGERLREIEARGTGTSTARIAGR